MPKQWPRALLRAALLETGYDALGAPDLEGALLYPAEAEDRGPVRLVLVDESTLSESEAQARLGELLRRHRQPNTVLLAHARFAHPPAGVAAASGWNRIVRRPVSVAELVARVRELLPLPPNAGTLE